MNKNTHNSLHNMCLIESCINRHTYMEHVTSIAITKECNG